MAYRVDPEILAFKQRNEQTNSPLYYISIDFNLCLILQAGPQYGNLKQKI